MKRLKFLIVFLIFTGFTARADLLTPFTDVVLKSVEPGKEYILKGPNNKSFMVKNTSNSKIKVEIKVGKPAKSDLKEDYKKIPDTDWISLKDKNLTVGPGEWNQTEIVLKVPDEKKYFGNRYQAYIQTRTAEGKIRAGLRSRILFTVGERKGIFKRIFWFLR